MVPFCTIYFYIDSNVFLIDLNNSKPKSSIYLFFIFSLSFGLDNNIIELYISSKNDLYFFIIEFFNSSLLNSFNETILNVLTKVNKLLTLFIEILSKATFICNNTFKQNAHRYIVQKVCRQRG